MKQHNVQRFVGVVRSKGFNAHCVHCCFRNLFSNAKEVNLKKCLRWLKGTAVECMVGTDIFNNNIERNSEPINWRICKLFHFVLFFCCDQQTFWILIFVEHHTKHKLHSKTFARSPEMDFLWSSSFFYCNIAFIILKDLICIMFDI